MGLCEMLDMRVVQATKDCVVMEMPVTDDVCQPHGFLHGGATIALLESAASVGARLNANLALQRPFGVEVCVRHRKSTKSGMVRGVAKLSGQEVSAHSGALKQTWDVAAYDDAGKVISQGSVMTKIVSLEYLAAKERSASCAPGQ